VKQEMILNAAGRYVPRFINGVEHVPFKGVGKRRPSGKMASVSIPTAADYPIDGNKIVPDLRTALELCGVKDGMTISNHHHFRNGDLVMTKVFDTLAEMGRKDLRWFPSASFPCQASIIDHMKSGVVHHIEGSMNGPLGAYCSVGEMQGMAVLRSHGGRYQAIQDGEVHIDVAIVAAPAADMFGNATGDRGESACGPITLALADSLWADKVIVVTDNLVPFPCIPWQIKGNYVDYVVQMDKIGDPSQIVSGTTQITKSPDRLLIAEYAAQFVEEAGIVHDGFSFQAGAGGTSLAFTIFLRDIMRRNKVKASFIHGGSSEYLVQMLEEGLTNYILDGQAFDLESIRSIRENPNHILVSPFNGYDYHSKGNFASMMDTVVLGATEVDVNFNANVVTHSDGMMLHGIGGWQNCIASKCTILAVPTFRNRIPVIVDKVTTLCGPGEMIDVVVTERGIAINPQRADLLEKFRGSSLPIVDIHDLQAEVEDICGGKPEPPRTTDRVVAAIKWVDGTVIDCVRQVVKD